MILNSLVIAFWNLTKIVVLLFVIVFGIVGIIAMINSTIDNFKNRKINDEALKSLNETFDKMLEDLQKQQEKDKTPKNPRTKKVDKKEE